MAFALPPAFALSGAFSRAFDGSFLGAFFGAFLGAFLGGFSFAFAFARDVEWRAIGKLTFTFTFTLVSTGWGSNGVCERREVVIILLGSIVRDGRLSGSATAFGGYARANPEGSSGGTRIARAGLGLAGCIRHGGHGQVDEETVVGSAGEFLGGGTNMRAGIGEVLGDELTTLGEADGAIEKRAERRRDERAIGFGLLRELTWGAPSGNQRATV